MHNIITSAIAGLIGAAAGLFLYKSGKQSGYTEGYDKADNFNKSNKDILDSIEKIAAITATPMRTTSITETRTVNPSQTA